MQERFTIDGSDALEQRLSRTCDRVLSGLCAVLPQEKIEAVYLGGGYGRGEGGVLKTEEGDSPYNDMEFWVFLRGNQLLNERRFGNSLHTLGQVLTPESGIDIEFKIASIKSLANPPPTMFAYDLAKGHRRIFGHGGLLNEEVLHDSSKIPLYEATRLLMNRCSGLLFSQERLQHETFGPEEADFVGRNQAKAQLGFGDALLASVGQYHWSCRERNERLKKLSENSMAGQMSATWPFSLSQIYCHHSAGVDFKLHPQKRTGSRETFQPVQTDLLNLGLQLWLWLENRRLDQEFTTPRDYAFSAENKCPETNPARNRLVNFKTFGVEALLDAQASRYPRERILNSLCLMLWEFGLVENDFLLEKVQKDLRTTAATFTGLVSAYEDLWRRFN